MREVVLALALAAAFPLSVPAQSTPPTAHPPATDEFADKATISNKYEVQAGEIAEETTDNAAVERFARMIVQDHQKAMGELGAIVAGLQNVKIPESLDTPHMSMLQQLKMLSGEQFIAAFKLQQVEAHKQAILLVKAYAESGENGKLRDWAAKTLPTLQKHLAQAQQLPPNPGQPAIGDYITSPGPAATSQPAATTAQAPEPQPAGTQGSGGQPATAISQAPGQQPAENAPAPAQQPAGRSQAKN